MPIGALEGKAFQTSYLPNRYLRATKGFNVTEFENDLYKACPCEEGFLKDAGAKSRAIMVTNYSGEDISVVLNETGKLNKALPDVRWNEVELDGFLLPNGCSSHFSVPPWNYEVSVSEWVLDERGVKQQLTREGFSLGSLQNQVITYHDGEGQGLTEPIISNQLLQHFCEFQNDSSNDITLIVTKTKTAYAPTEEQIKMQKLSRIEDNGGQEVARRVLRPGSRWCYKPKINYYYVRALETHSEATNTNYDHDHLFGDDTVDPKTNYVEETFAKAKAGEWVVFLKDISDNGGKVAKTYKAREIKPVKSTIVETSRSEL